MSKYWSRIIKELEPYVPGEQPKEGSYIKLNTNENPYPPSPKVLAAIQAAANESLRLYPDPSCDALKAAIAGYYEIEKANVFVGNGSDEVLALSFMAFFKQPHPILFPDITYSFYDVYCSIFEVQYSKMPLTDAFDIFLQDYLQPNGGIIFPNPNAPTGKLISLSRIEDLLKQNRESVVIVDEAYIDFGGESAVALTGEYPNLLVAHTFSKSRSLAGMRIGFAMGSETLIEGLERAKNSFNSYPLDRLAITGAIAAIQDDIHFQETRKKVMATREATVRHLAEMGFSILPSAANFIFVTHPRLGARELYQRLKEQKILVRYFNKPRINDYLRITIGTESDMKALVEALAPMIPR